MSNTSSSRLLSLKIFLSQKCTGNPCGCLLFYKDLNEDSITTPEVHSVNPNLIRYNLAAQETFQGTFAQIDALLKKSGNNLPYLGGLCGKSVKINLKELREIKEGEAIEKLLNSIRTDIQE